MAEEAVAHSARAQETVEIESSPGSFSGGGADPFLELYKLAVEMADHVSARRATANGFFLTLNSALLVVVGLVRPAEGGSATVGTSANLFGTIILSVAGIVVSLAWWGLLRSYRALNAAKFCAINRMEAQLPAAPFTDEWEFLKGQSSGSWWRRYLELGMLERVVPLVYVTLYLATGIRALVS